MSTESPRVGEISADGQFSWDGQQWAPLARGRREPTSWTVPLQRTVAAFFAVNAVWSILATALFVSQAAAERSVRAANPTLGEDQVRAAAQLASTVGWITVVVLALLMLALAVCSLRGWRWVFWVDLVLVAFGSIGVIMNSLALGSPSTQTLPPAAIAVGLLLSVAALALVVWLIVAAARYGPWAMKRPGA
jgi:hypothetical protein